MIYNSTLKSKRLEKFKKCSQTIQKLSLTAVKSLSTSLEGDNRRNYGAIKCKRCRKLVKTSINEFYCRKKEVTTKTDV